MGKYEKEGGEKEKVEDREFDQDRIERAVSEFIEERDNKRAGTVQRGGQ